MYEEKFSGKASASMVCTPQVIAEEGLVISASFHSGKQTSIPAEMMQPFWLPEQRTMPKYAEKKSIWYMM
jgi:hypothetical protein